MELNFALDHPLLDLAGVGWEVRGGAEEERGLSKGRSWSAVNNY